MTKKLVLKNNMYWKEKMEDTLFTGLGSNMLTVAISLSLYVIYKRCLQCKSHLHTSWLDCETEKVREAKKLEKISVVKEALAQHQRETLRDHPEARLQHV